MNLRIHVCKEVWRTMGANLVGILDKVYYSMMELLIMTVPITVNNTKPPSSAYLPSSTYNLTQSMANESVMILSWNNTIVKTVKSRISRIWQHRNRIIENDWLSVMSATQTWASEHCGGKHVSTVRHKYKRISRNLQCLKNYFFELRYSSASVSPW